MHSHIQQEPAPEALAELRAALFSELAGRHGLLLGGVDLAMALGHRSAASLRQARRRGHVAIALFTLPKRKGHFALSSEVADWLARARLGVEKNREGMPPNERTTFHSVQKHESPRRSPRASRRHAAESSGDLSAASMREATGNRQAERGPWMNSPFAGPPWPVSSKES
jgi:hypothetical protein